MNLTRVLNNALPDMPARVLAERPPRLDPGAVAKEHVVEGQVEVRVYVPSAKSMFTFPPQNWKLARLFDGLRTYQEVAEVFSRETGAEYSAAEVQEFADNLDAIDFWYRTPQEKNILLMQQSADERRKKLKQQNRWADLSDVLFPAFNPDPVLTKFYSYTKWVYSKWFTGLTLAFFAFTVWITVTHWSAIGRDTERFYNFSNKSFADILVLYIILAGIVVVHELAHAYTSKHFGGRVTAMGFALVYLTPAVYTDTTEAEVTATRNQRLVITVAGVWSELIICSFATVIWWGSAPDTPIHNAAYFMMMMTGIMSVLLNWNPLMKLDGYYMLTDITGIADIKENSTAYVSAWVKKHIWRLPVEVPHVPKKRRWWFALYAIASGAYSYTVLYVVARFAGNIVRNFSPDWGFVPEIAVALLIFRSRIRLLVNFMKFLYLDKKDRIATWWTPRNSLLAGACAVLLLALPIWKESALGRFVLEPAKYAVIRARVPGVITQLDVSEGQKVEAGERLAVLRDLQVESRMERAKADLAVTSRRAASAALRYNDYGQARVDEESMVQQVAQASQIGQALDITSPIAGTVITARVRDLLGSYRSEGEELLEVGDLSFLRARIYLSEYELHKVKTDAGARIEVPGRIGTFPARVVSIAARPTEMDPSLPEKSDLEGMNAPHYYVADLVVQNTNGALKPGMVGTARLYGERRSIGGMVVETVRIFLGRKIW